MVHKAAQARSGMNKAAHVVRGPLEATFSNFVNSFGIFD